MAYVPVIGFYYGLTDDESCIHDGALHFYASMFAQIIGCSAFLMGVISWAMRGY